MAFSTIAAVEVCYKKITGKAGDYSVQQLLDCGFGFDRANGCKGAPYYAYMRWIEANQPNLTREADYPYLGMESTYNCPQELPAFNQGARVTKVYFTNNNGTEEHLKKLVRIHGAVVVTVGVNKAFKKYKSGIFEGCEPDPKLNHAVTVVGYDSEEGVDFWRILNSSGEVWGEQGFMRLRRGVGMCGIGPAYAAVECEADPDYPADLSKDEL